MAIEFRVTWAYFGVGRRRARRGAARSATLLALLALTGPGLARADVANPLADLVDAAAQRLAIAEPVAAAKWTTRTPIEDPSRVQQQLAALAADAAAHNVDPDYVTRVFADQIGATEALEYQHFAQWKLDPASIPVAAPDLSTSRAVADDLNGVMLGEIRLQWAALHSPECAGRLEAARREASSQRQLDAVYRRALSFATRSYCAP